MTEIELFLLVSVEGTDVERAAELFSELHGDLVREGFSGFAVEAAEGPLSDFHCTLRMMVDEATTASALLIVLSTVQRWVGRGGGPPREVTIKLGSNSLVLRSDDDQEWNVPSWLHSWSHADEWRVRGITRVGISELESTGLTGWTPPRWRGAPTSGAESTSGDRRADVNVAADMPSQLQVGVTVSVACRISRDQIDAIRNRVLDQGRVSADTARKITIEVLPKANVEIVGDDRTEVDVPGEGQPSEVYFDVRATHPGTCQVWVVVRQGPVPLLTLRLEAPAELTPLPGPASRVPASGGLSVAGRTGLDQATWLSVVELERGQDTVYRYELRSSTLDILQTFESPPLRHRAEYVAGLYREIEERWLANTEDTENFQQELREFGGSLLSQLFPEKLQDILWRSRDSLKDLLVLSSEPFIPWELVHLKEPGQPLPNESRFLAETGLVRWLYTADSSFPPDTLYARDGQVSVICPHYADPKLDLPSARREAKFLDNLLGARLVPPGESEARKLLRSGDFDILHFAGHAHADSGEIANSKLLFEGRMAGQTYVPSSISATTVEQLARLAHQDGSRPMVVLNACQAGRLGAQMSSLGGFAKAFLDRGAGAFISSMWSVGDYPASTFVKTLYTELVRDQPISAAATTARQAARRAGDATWLSYAVYAHPRARLRVGTDPEVLQEFQDGGVGLAAALAHGLQAVADAVVAHVVDHRRHQPGAAAAKRVTEGDRAAVGVELGRVGADVGQPGERHGRERLVDLEGADVGQAQAALVQGLARRRDRCGQHDHRVVGGEHGGVDAGDRGQAEPGRVLARRHQQRGGAVADLRAVARMDHAVGAEGRLDLGHAL
jgi:hypothetical protein